MCLVFIFNAYVCMGLLSHEGRPWLLSHVRIKIEKVSGGVQFCSVQLGCVCMSCVCCIYIKCICGHGSSFLRRTTVASESGQNQNKKRGWGSVCILMYMYMQLYEYVCISVTSSQVSIKIEKSISPFTPPLAFVSHIITYTYT